MRKFRVEVFEDGRPIRLDHDVVEGTNHGVACRRAFQLAKPKMRRGAKTVTTRTTILPAVTAAAEKED